MRLMWRTLVMGMCLGLWGEPSVSQALSPVNLNQGYPTQLDDAYPVPKGSLVIQNGLRTDVFEVSRGTDRGRVRTIHDLRAGVGEHTELTVGAIGLKGLTHPGTLENPSALNIGVMTQVYRAGDAPSFLPSVGVRVTAGIPLQGQRQTPSLQTALLTSWKVGHDWWVSNNVWYGVVPEFEVGHWVQGRTSLWGDSLGAVHAFTPTVAVVMNVNAHQDPLTIPTGGRMYWVVNPELGMIWAPHNDLHLSLGVGRDFGGAMGQALVRSTIGVTYVF